MTGAQTTWRFFQHAFIHTAVTVVASLSLSPVALAEVVIFDGFGDADRDNDGVIEFYDTDLNDSGTWNDATEDADLITRGITEVTAATNASDVGIIWSGLRSFDTTANIAKGKVRIINDNVPIGSETVSQIHNDGLALGVETRGGGSPIMGRFPQSVELGLEEGDMVVASVDFRSWSESNTPAAHPVINEIRWGLFEDTDGELGESAPYGDGWFNNGGNGATVVWGRDDGNWYKSDPGAEGDKGIHVGYEYGDTFFTAESNARIRWEYNLAGINGTNPATTGSDGRILEGLGVSATPGAGGDVATIATPTGMTPDGPGGDFDLNPHTLRMEIIRLADGLVQVASFIDGAEILRDEIKTTDTGYALLEPPAFSYDYVAFRPTSDFDYVIDNFQVEVIGSNEGLTGDHNGDGKVDAADYVAWRKDPAGFGGDPDGYIDWRENFGAGNGPGGAPSSIPEPASTALLMIGGLLATGTRRRDSRSYEAARA
jgi:hypothetical protein